jgi:zinc transport system ATP-binding protein
LHAAKKLLIDLDEVSVLLGGEQVLDSVSLCVHNGEFIGLIGPNGAGKTTLLRAILGLQSTTSGVVRRTDATYEYIPQRGNLYNGLVPMSVLEVVMIGSRGNRISALETLQTVRLEDAADKSFSELSGGQQQRVAIAKALAANAEVLILDEPTTGIDEQSQRDFYALLSELQAGGVTIIMVSHEVEAVLKLVTRVICINRSLLYDGPPEHFESDKYLPKVYTAQHQQLHHHHEGDATHD